MVMRLACQPRQEGSLKELARWLQAKTQKSVCLASELMSGKKCENTAVAPTATASAAAVAVHAGGPAGDVGHD
jgi:hypothetical protein